MSMMSISGLASGLDTATIISQLMQLEAIPQTRLQNRVETEEGALRSFQSLNTDLAVLASKADTTKASQVWTGFKATSTSASVSVSATASAMPGTFSVEVGAVAVSHQVSLASSAALTDVVTTGATTVKLDRLDGTSVTVETGDGTLQGLVNALNDPANETGVRATPVKGADGSYRLLVESSTTGAAADFALTNADGSAILGGAAATRAGSNASVTIGGISVESASNTFTDLVPGVSVTLAAGAQSGDRADVVVKRDVAGAAASVKALVDKVNSALDYIDSNTAYNPATKSGGVFTGDSTVRTIRNQLATVIYPADGTSMAELGLEVDRDGRLVFDEAVFTKAYEADPAGMAAAFGATDDGFAARVAEVAGAASDSETGSITVAIKGRTDGIERLSDSIDQWDRRLELRERTLARQFTALETALSTMNGQASWLAGQISSLPSANS